MNHVLKEAGLDRSKNLQTYNQPELPIKPELVDSIVSFIEKGRIEHGKSDNENFSVKCSAANQNPRFDLYSGENPRPGILGVFEKM